MIDVSTPLISICVITYNSSKYVLEALESAKLQTYQNIELIVSDDCSTDNTVQLCRAWIEKNKERFIRTEIVTAEKNTGIGKNCNRGIFKASGQWIKLIAGDDALMETCIEDYVIAIRQNPSYYFFHSQCAKYKELFINIYKMPVSKIFPNEIFRKNEDYTLQQQYENLLLSSSIDACTTIYHTDLLKSLGGFEEKISKSEDWPTFLKIVQKGYKFYFLDKVTVKYRVNSSSVFSGSSKNSIFPLFYKTEKEIYKYYIKENASFCVRWYWKYVFFYKDILVLLRMTDDTLFNKFVYKVLYKMQSGIFQYLQYKIKRK